MYTSITDKQDLNRDLWIEVDLAAISHNMRIIRLLSRSKRISAVVKADGYGHGAVAVGAALLEGGADHFCVATPDEAYELRAAFPDVSILVLSEVDTHLASELAKQRIAVTATSAEKMRRFADQLFGSDLTLCVHIKVDTGMGRIGCVPSEASAEAFAEAIRNINLRSPSPSIRIEGVFSHFAKADDRDKTFSHLQAKRFVEFVAMLEKRGICPPVKHMANSAAVIDLPEYHFDMVRAGILLFGMTPTGEPLSAFSGSSRLREEDRCLKPALSIKSRVIFAKKLDEAMGIGYGHTFAAPAGSVVVTVPAGYADGISRLLSGKMEVLIGGRRCRQVGNICMDHFMALAYDGVRTGDEIVIVGTQSSSESESERITAEELAGKMGTLNYEILCMLSKRIPRVYLS